MIELQPDTQHNYFPGYYSHGDHTMNGGCNFRLLTNVNQIITNGHSHIGSVTSPIMDQQFACKEMLKQIMLQHEEIFRSQVRELHRLYNRQRELMDEANRIHLYSHHLRLETSQANPFFSQNEFSNPSNACQVLGVPWLSSATVQAKCWQASDGHVQTEGPNKESFEMPETKFKKVGKKLLDLELPADEYLDSEEDESPTEERVKSSEDSHLLVREDDNNQASFLRKSVGLADLNEPIKLEDKTNTEYNDHGEFISDFQVLPKEITQTIQTKNDEASGEDCCGQSRSLLVDGRTMKSPCEDHGLERFGSDISANGCAGNDNAACKQPSNELTDMLNNESPEQRLQTSDPVRVRIVVQALPCSSFSNKRRYPKGLNAKLNFQHSCDTERGAEDPVDGRRKQVMHSDCLENDNPCNKSFGFDLNSCIDEVYSSPTSPLSAEITNLEVPTSPESEEKQCNCPLLEEGIRIAADTIVSISSEINAVFKPTESSGCNFLRWLSRIASSVVDDPENELGVALSWKETKIHEGGYFSDGIDYFEAMTLKLEDENFEDHVCLIAKNDASPMCQDPLLDVPNKVRTKRARQQRKDFQSEILPSLASLSRQEVSKDLQAIGSLIDQRNIKNGHMRGCRRRRRNSISWSLNADKESLIEWGKITRRRRRPRRAARNPRFMLGAA